MRPGCDVIALLLIAVVLTACMVASPSAATRSPPSELHMALQSTVQLSLVTTRADDLGRPIFRVQDGRSHYQLIYDEGLGTAVRAGTRHLIITHDHWCQLNARLLYVQIRDFRGKTLVYLQPDVFRRTIVYRDGGTMAFLAPETIPTLVTLSPLPEPHIGESVQVVTRAGPGAALHLVEARISAVAASGEPRSFRLRAVDDRAFLAGDSGAGIWLGDRLLGNLWAVLDEQPIPKEGTALCTPRATDVSIAARLPAIDALLR